MTNVDLASMSIEQQDAAHRGQPARAVQAVTSAIGAHWAGGHASCRRAKTGGYRPRHKRRNRPIDRRWLVVLRYLRVPEVALACALSVCCAFFLHRNPSRYPGG